MVGKVVNRLRLHPTAPKLPGRWGEGDLNAFAATSTTGPTTKVLLTSNIFAGVNIDPKSLARDLEANLRSTAAITKDANEKSSLSKKVKMKLRKERWLQKIENIKLTKQQQKAEARRKATPVVGDMQPLMDALPELSDLVTDSKSGKQNKILKKKKKVPVNFTQLKSPQRHKILMEELAQFQKTIMNPLFKANPLAVVGDHLSKRLKQEREGECL